jgi:uncharacterized protein
MAYRLLHPPPACVIAIGGFSGSGKSTLARMLAPLVGAVPGATLLRTDEIRKRLCGVDVLTRLGPEGYAPDMSERVYATAAARASVIARAGQAAIVDAVFAGVTDRERIERAAADLSVPFVGVWLEAPAPVLTARVQHRRHDPSDADVEVVRAQLAQDPGPMRWHRVDASRPIEMCLRDVAAVLAGLPKDAVVRV